MKAELYNDNCFSIFPEIETNSIDLILTDLPYGTTKCKWDSILPLDELWSHYKRIIKPNGAIILNACQPFTSQLVLSNPEWFRYLWYWNKGRGGNFLFASKQPHKSIEEIAVFYQRQPTYNPIMEPANKPASVKYNESCITGREVNPAMPAILKSAANYDPTKTYPKALINIPRENKPIHPTQKPVKLGEYLIQTYSNPGGNSPGQLYGSGELWSSSRTSESKLYRDRIRPGLLQDSTG